VRSKSFSSYQLRRKKLFSTYRMRLLANLICEFLFIFVFVTTSTSAYYDDGGFLNATCNEAQDCYVIDDLHLACWTNFQKCKCENTFRSNFHLKWDNVRKECLMSKYGPCGEKSADLRVGCQDNYVCVDNQCRDPKDTSTKAVKLTPFVFEESECSSSNCKFSDDLRLTCNLDHCSCEKVYIADISGTYWDIRNYDGDRNCSVGKFGPCGTNNGLTIECHGDGITCVNGTCLNASHVISDLGEDCAYVKNCKEGLQCSVDSVCIEPFSVPSGERCKGTMQCQNGLNCRRNGPWSSAFCQET